MITIEGIREWLSELSGTRVCASTADEKTILNFQKFLIERGYAASHVNAITNGDSLPRPLTDKFYIIFMIAFLKNRIKQDTDALGPYEDLLKYMNENTEGKDD